MKRMFQAKMASIPWGGGLLPVMVVFFVLVRVAEAEGSLPGWLAGYGDDLLCMPLVLGLILLAHRWVAGDGRTLPVSHGLLAVGVFSIFFELILPAIGSAAVGDPLDVLMYLAGFLIFQVFINRGIAPRGNPGDIPHMKFSPLLPTNLFRRNHGHL